MNAFSEPFQMLHRSCGRTGHLARLKKGETIDKLLFDGYSTISLGYAGLYEMCMRMLGKSHTDPEATAICTGSYAASE